MSTIEQLENMLKTNKTNRVEILKEESITVSYIDYLYATLSHSDLASLFTSSKYCRLMEYWRQYGDAVFQDLVKLTATITESSIRDILKDFSIHRANLT